MVSTHLKNISQNGNLPQVGVKIKNIWNHHLEQKHHISSALGVAWLGGVKVSMIPLFDAWGGVKQDYEKHQSNGDLVMSFIGVNNNSKNKSKSEFAIYTIDHNPLCRFYVVPFIPESF